MDTKVITAKEMTENNPTLCMAPIRYFNRCHQCNVFKSVLKRNEGDMIKTIEMLTCNPHITDKAIFLIGKREAIKKATEKKLKNIDEELGEVKK